MASLPIGIRIILNNFNRFWFTLFIITTLIGISYTLWLFIKYHKNLTDISTRWFIVLGIFGIATVFFNLDYPKLESYTNYLDFRKQALYSLNKQANEADSFWESLNGEKKDDVIQYDLDAANSSVVIINRLSKDIDTFPVKFNDNSKAMDTYNQLKPVLDKASSRYSNILKELKSHSTKGKDGMTYTIKYDLWSSLTFNDQLNEDGLLVPYFKLTGNDVKTKLPIAPNSKIKYNPTIYLPTK